MRYIKKAEAIRQHWKKVKAAGGKKKGPVHTEESKAKLREAHLGKKLTASHRRKLCLAKLGRRQSVKKALAAKKKGGR